MFHVKSVDRGYNLMDSKHLKIGEIGERIAERHLERKGFQLLDRNFRTRVGEIDLIMEHEKVIHFVEVKTVSRETFYMKQGRSVPHGTYRPEEKVHASKLRKILKSAEIWLLKNKYKGDWEVDVASVKVDPESRKGTIKLIWNVIDG